MKKYLVEFYGKSNRMFQRCNGRCAYSVEVDAPGRKHARHIAWIEIKKTEFRRFGPIDFKLKVTEI